MENVIPQQDAEQTQQHITLLQSCGFGGLWRFAGPFIAKQAAAKPSVSVEMCICLERLVGSLGEVPPLTPPPPSPRFPTHASFDAQSFFRDSRGRRSWESASSGGRANAAAMGNLDQPSNSSGSDMPLTP